VTPSLSEKSGACIFSSLVGLIDLEDKDHKFLQNVMTHSPSDIASHSRRPEYSLISS
jgi:hypothetical protein